jgi:hypothetical protein
VGFRDGSRGRRPTLFVAEGSRKNKFTFGASPKQGALGSNPADYMEMSADHNLTSSNENVGNAEEYIIAAYWLMYKRLG